MEKFSSRQTAWTKLATLDPIGWSFRIVSGAIPEEVLRPSSSFDPDLPDSNVFYSRCGRRRRLKSQSHSRPWGRGHSQSGSRRGVSFKELLALPAREHRYLPPSCPSHFFPRGGRA